MKARSLVQRGLPMRTRFSDRKDAGRMLAKLLTKFAGRSDVLVLGLPRGGVPVAFEVALALNAPLEVFVVRKLGLPGNEELAMGAIASGGVRVLNSEIVNSLRISSGERSDDYPGRRWHCHRFHHAGGDRGASSVKGEPYYRRNADRRLVHS